MSLHYSMFGKKKCSGCGKKGDKKFSYCPWCGNSFETRNEKEDFGILGKEDSFNMNDMKLPFGFNKIVGSLMKQLEKQLGEMDNRQGGFKIQISSGKPVVQKMTPKPVMNEKRDSFEKKRKAFDESLPRVDVESAVRRIDDQIVYELEVPGVRDKENVLISKLEKGLEVRAYSKDKCYVKTIPLKVELVGWSLSGEKLFVKLKG